MAGAPVGNTNSNRNNRMWADTIRRALVQSDGQMLRKLADALIEKAAEGDVTALKEIGDRLDGKPHQTTDTNVSGELGIQEIVRRVVDPRD